MSEFRLGHLTIRFDTKVSRALTEPEANTETVLSPTDTAISAIQNQRAQEALERDEIAIRQEQLAQMMIEDPAQAEKLLIGDELDDDEPNEPGEGA